MAPDALSPAVWEQTAGASATSPGGVAQRRGSVRDLSIWRDAAVAWLAQHVFFLVPIFLNIALAVPQPLTARRIGLPWLNWDGWIYVDIAQRGYGTLDQAAFFPLYPLVTRLVAFCLGGHTALAALLVANAASFGAYGLFLLLVEQEFGRRLARRGLLFLLCFPAAFFLAAAYTESLFLLLSLGAFVALRRHAWLAAGALAALATLTRPVGILLLLPLGAELARQSGIGDWLRGRSGTPSNSATLSKSGIMRMAASGLLLPVLALAAYCGFLALRFGHPLGFLNAEGGTWGRRASWPWDSFVRAATAVLHDPPNQALPAALDLLLMALFIAAIILAVRRLPLPYALYGIGSLLLIILLPMHRENWGALSSNKRFMVDVFPMFMALATVRSRRWIEPLAVILSVLLQVLLTVVYLQRGWVA